MTRPTLSAAVALLLVPCPARAADWPQWRGPDRSNVSKEKGLLAEWPREGPPLAWRATGLGDGVAPVSVAGGRVFATGNVGGDVVCTARGEKDGKEIWAAKLGPAAKESAIMRWLAQAAPTVDGDRVFAVTANGDYVCLAADTGKVLWRKHFAKDFGGRKGSWGFCDYPLADGDRLVVCPGGDRNTVAALDKKTGDLVWGCAIEKEVAAHSVLIRAEFGGVKQYVVHLGRGMYGVSDKGELLWKYTALGGAVATTHAPVAGAGDVFFANGYGTGRVLLKLAQRDKGWTVEEAYREKVSEYVPWLGSPTAVGDRILVNTATGLHALERKSGKVAWEEKKLGRCTYTVAGGRVFVRTQSGKLILATADAEGYRELSRFEPPRPDKAQPAWTFPVVSNGRLYVRDYDALLCYDVRDPAAREGREKVPDAVFVPTPPDVVERMLALAAVGKGDVVYDLGSGDGRIVIAAARGRGCKAVGVELDRGLVAKSRERARAAGVEGLATFERGDLFEADFSGASVVALYVLPGMSRKLLPKFDKLRPGSRIVAHCFPIPGMKPDRVLKVTSDEDDVERPLYLYTVPLRKEKHAGR